MKKKQVPKLNSLNEIKIFLLYLLDNIRYPIDYTTLIDIISRNTDEITFNYNECLDDLVARGHLWFDEMSGEKYYMISDKGRMVASELYETIDPDLRESSIITAAKYVSVQRGGVSSASKIEKTEDNRYIANIVASDSKGEILNLSLTVSTRTEAELIISNFEKNPDGVYRGILFASTKRFEYFS